MASPTEIKTWIKEVKMDKPFSDDSILIQKEGVNKTKITLLDIACCRPSFYIEKPVNDIVMADIEAKREQINHTH